MWALVIKEFRELARDRRTLAMLVVMPVLLLIIFGYAANFSVDRVSATIVGPEAEALAQELQEYDTAAEDLEIVGVEPSLGDGDVEELLRQQDSAAVIVADDSADAEDPLSDRMRVSVDGSSLFPAQEAKAVFMRLAAEDGQNRIADAQDDVDEARQQAEDLEAEFDEFGEEMAGFGDAVSAALAAGTAPPDPPSPPDDLETPDLPEVSAPELDPDDLVTVMFNPDLKTSWVMVPGLIGLILTFIGTLITSIGLVRERETGTLEQLAVMPLGPGAIILGKIVPYFLLALVDIALVTLLGVWLFDVPFSGSVWLFALAAVVFCFVVLGIGVLISSISQTTGQAIQAAIMFVVPQVLLSGLIFPLGSMPAGVRWIGYVLPLTWFREIAQGIMLRGAGLESLWFPLVVLVGMAVIAFGASTARMRFSLTHGGAR